MGRKKMYGLELLLVIGATLGVVMCSTGEHNSMNVFAWLIWWRIVVGIGVGADYPLSAVITSEFAPTRHRARMMAAVFFMQPLGQISGNVVSLLVVLGVRGQHGPDTIKEVDRIWRWVIGVGILPGLFAVVFRVAIPETPRYILDIEDDPIKAEFDAANLFGESPADIELESHDWGSQVADLQSPNEPRIFSDTRTLTENSVSWVVGPSNAPPLKWGKEDAYRYFWLEGNWRTLAGTCLCWFFMDFGYYGISLSSPQFLAKTWGALHVANNSSAPIWLINDAPNASVYNMFMDTSVHALVILNVGSFIGGLLLILLANHVNRTSLQKYGFLVLAALFIAMGSMFAAVQKTGAVAIVLYVICQIAFNLGPNGTTFMIPAEVFPTRYRSSCHGISAGAGKLGSILVQIFSAYVKFSGSSPFRADTKRYGQILLVFSVFMIAGAVITHFWIPDTQYKGRKEKSLEVLATGRAGLVAMNRESMRMGRTPSYFGGSAGDIWDGTHQALSSHLDWMNVVAWHALRVLPRASPRATCRLIAGRRYPLPIRSFHRSAIAYRDPRDPDSRSPAPRQDDDSIAPPEPTAAEVTELDDQPETEVQREKNNYGSAARRSMRNKKPKEIPPIIFPDWFLAKNVKSRDSLSQKGTSLGIYEENSADDSAVDPFNGKSQKQTEFRYLLPKNLWLEILATTKASLDLPPSRYADDFLAEKHNLLLQCPHDGGTFFLDAVTESVARSVGADLVRIDAQDIAEIGGDYIGERPGAESIRSLGYDAYRSRQDFRETEDIEEDDEEFSLEDEDDEPTSRSPGRPAISKFSAIPIGTITGSLEDFLKSANKPGRGSGDWKPQKTRYRGLASGDWDDMKLSALIETWVDACQLKRTPGSVEVHSVLGADPSKKLIIAVRDFKEVFDTSQGAIILSRLVDIVQRRRKEGQSVIIIGSISSEALMPSFSKSGIKSLQGEYEDGVGRTIVVPPGKYASNIDKYNEDDKQRLRLINTRHLRDMLRRLGYDVERHNSAIDQLDLRLDTSQTFASGLEEYVWPFNHVHRVAATALGLLKPDEALTQATLQEALLLLDSSDQEKFEMAAEERERMKEPEEKPTTGKDTEEKMKKLRKSCNKHEKKLLGGVVNPEHLHTTFADVQTSPQTVEALRTLTSLSLVRPEAFTYGVLSTDKIPGLLLYGPPGTGKTLLAKAVAKESGATVLEVSGSEVYDMYVGEGEKNVKAIFTLAKKLSPCVVFIDEADAIFGSRGGNASRTSHRELINQFLREWDGMNDLSAFIMVATNRPFDLDDAVLRRLPRRLLIDLPVEKDREAILKIHLRDESLDSSVILSELAAQTPLYSGSDLKNLSVAAALACVREENDVAAQHQGSEAYQYPEKRVLAKRHFEQAMDEISASISEDMSSLSAIKKFDEKYGDRRGRRKKSAAWGFATALESEKTETGRVRN
ncbi:MAG: hypothetical protein M1819_002152 [Sarea resinae]|nr:MAG: hypothetical protein M1819_002152 [Sarea resinae]